MSSKRVAKPTGKAQVGQVVGQGNVRPKMLSRATRQGQADENPHHGEAFPRWMFAIKGEGTVTLQIAEALACTNIGARRLSNELLGAVVRAALFHHDGREWFTATALACDGNDALLAELRAYMRESFESVLKLGEVFARVRGAA